MAAGLFGKKNKTCHAYFTAYCHKTMKRVCKKKWEKNEKAGHKTVFAPESGMMRTFDKKNLGKTPPPFPHTPQKNLGRLVCVDRVGAHILRRQP